MIRLSEPLLRQLREHGVSEYPYECCGVLLGSADGNTKTVTELRPVKNVHEEGHERRFLISPHDMFGIEREARALGVKVLGFYHSHPDHPARPSEYDRDWAWPWYSYIITSVASGEPGDTTCWTLREDRSAFTQEEIEIQ